jgi:hypothetical protein
MKNTKKHMTSTQMFTEIQDIVDEVVLLGNGHGCGVIEVEASNFSLLSEQEQMARISAYANLLNSLSFPIQILIRNKQVDVSSYINQLNDILSSTTTVYKNLPQEKNHLLLDYIKKYRDFVQTLVKINIVLDKSFYVVLPYSPFEGGIGSAIPKKREANSSITAAKAAIKAKANALQGQLERLGLRSTLLTKEALIRLFYDMYNEGHSVPQRLGDGLVAPIVQSASSAVKASPDKEESQEGKL